MRIGIGEATRSAGIIFLAVFSLVSLAWAQGSVRKVGTEGGSLSAPVTFQTGTRSSNVEEEARSEELRSLQSTTEYRIRLDLVDPASVQSALALGLEDPRLGSHEYKATEAVYQGLIRAGFKLRLLGGETTHRFFLDPADKGRLSPQGEEPRTTSVVKAAGSFYISSGTVNDVIPDSGWMYRWVQVISGAPAGSVTTGLQYRLRIHSDSNPGGAYCGDYEIYLSSDSRGGGIPYHLVYNNLGGRNDDGWDDDTENDNDIYLNLRSTTAFNGEDPNQRFYVYIRDNVAGDAGYLGYIEFNVSWNSPSVDLQATDVYFRTQPSGGGTRVDNPQAGQQLYPHFSFSVNSTASVSGELWRLSLNGTTLCNSTTTLSPGAWIGSCNSPVSLAAGLHSLNGQVDPGGAFSETNENNNSTFRNYTVSGSPDIRISPLSLTFTSTGTAGAPSGDDATGSEPAMDWELASELVAKARETGKVRVIARLNAPFVPEGQLDSPQSVGRQRDQVRAAQDQVLDALEGLNARVKARFESVPYLALETDAAALSALLRLPGVTAIEEDVADFPTLASSNPVIGSPAAWAAGYTGSGQVVAVLDTGVDKSHPFFTTGRSKVVSEACYSTTSGSTSSSVCPGGVSSSTAAGSGVNCSTSIAGCDHGTHVAGIAAGNNGSGPNFGVARDADIIAVQVFSRFNGSGDCGSEPAPCSRSFVSDQVLGLERVYALRNSFNIAAVNMSLGGGRYFDRASCDAAQGSRKAIIDNLRAANIATVISSGNDGYKDSIGAPGCISSAISVGSTTDADAVSSFSNVASFLDLLAPGSSITSSVPGGGTSSFNGTSMAAPHVAGAWAILKQKKPTATVNEILASLRNTGTSVNDNRSGGTVTGMRRINVDDALDLAPASGQSFTIHNDGNATLSVTSMQLQTAGSWIQWSPQAPFDIAPGGSRQVTVTVNFSGAPAGQSTRRLLVSSNDSGESPYPGGVDIIVNKPSVTCYSLSRTRTGQGSDPSASPSNSTGCPSGQYTAGASIQVTASPSAGWTVGSWNGTTNNGSTSTSNNVTMPAGNHTVTVNYVQPSPTCYTLTRTHTGSGANPTASPANSTGCSSGQYTAGASVQVTASPSAGWSVGSWSGTANNGSTGLSNTVSMPAGSHTVAVNYVQQPSNASILLVDDDDNSPDVRSYYTAALDALGQPYQVWDTGNTDVEPGVTTLQSYKTVIWFTGEEFGGAAGPGAAGEADLSTFLSGWEGSCLLLSSQDYLFDRGVTPFASNYLGVSSWVADVGHGTVSGQGSAFSGMGPYALSYPFSNFSDQLLPRAGTEVAFAGDFGTAALSRIGPNHRTAFLGFPLEALPTATARRDVMAASLDFCATVFADVAPKHWARRWIEAIFRAGVTGGCGSNPRMYCPDGGVTRDQMAVFLLVSKEGAGYSPPPCTTASFSDVPVTSPFCPWIQELARRGVTTGCGGGKFCPQSVMTRDQMAVFLLATLEGPGYAPPACTAAPFNDVPVSSPFCGWIQELARRGVTGGCGGGSYCPGNPVNRAQMAIFLVSSFNLPLP